jgi:hypothetical protein
MDTAKCPFLFVGYRLWVIGYRRGLLFVIHGATGVLALADILCYLDMLRVSSIGVKILPCAEGASKANIMIGVLGVRDIDTYGLVHENINLVFECE